MKELFKMWLTKLACCHKWEELSVTKGFHGSECTSRVVLYTCEKCGKIYKDKHGLA